jgi:hypothetical protein
MRCADVARRDAPAFACLLLAGDVYRRITGIHLPAGGGWTAL